SRATPARTGCASIEIWATRSNEPSRQQWTAGMVFDLVAQQHGKYKPTREPLRADPAILDQDVAYCRVLAIYHLRRILRQHIAAHRVHIVRVELFSRPCISVATESIAHHVGVIGRGTGQV